MARPDRSGPRAARGMHVGHRHSSGGRPPSKRLPSDERMGALAEWARLGAEIAALGPHRLEIAAHAVRVAAAGGRGIAAEEESRIADWFRDLVQAAIQRGGARAARAIWSVLTSDSQRDPRGAWMARCPALEAIGCPAILDEGIEPADGGQIAEWLAKLPDAAASYVHHAVAGASADDVAELRELVQAGDDTLDAIYAPEPFALADHDPHEAMYEAMSTLTRRRIDNDQISGALEIWAFGSQTAVQEHAWEPPVRIGVCAWLARVALRSERG